LDVSDPASPVEVGFHKLWTEANSVAVAEDGSGQTFIYIANREGGLAVFRVRYRILLPFVLRNDQ
jgi:hypothetical protein